MSLTLEHMAVEQILALDKNVKRIYEEAHSWMRHAVLHGNLSLARTALSAGNARVWEALEQHRLKVAAHKSR